MTVTHPKVGDKFSCIWNNKYHEVEVWDKRSCTGSTKPPKSAYEYYIHYIHFDRRLDRWVRASELKPLNLCVSSDSNTVRKTKSLDRRYTQGDKRKYGDFNNHHPGKENYQKEHLKQTRVKNIEKIHIGKYIVDTWYHSPYPSKYRTRKKLYICEFCLKYMMFERTFVEHKGRCNQRSPQGKEIYSKDNLSIFEVDGKEHKIYCQCLCLLAKLFIDHKTLYYDVEPFVFYLLTERDENDHHHVVGYFSKEKSSPENHNLACLLTFPQYQRKGYGRLLIEMSYALSKLEKKTGSPEKPLSDMGRISYRAYWTSVMLDLLTKDPCLTIEDISKRTGINKADVIRTLMYLKLVRYQGQKHVIHATAKIIQHCKKSHLRKGRKKGPVLDISKLRNYTPRTNITPEVPASDHRFKKNSRNGTINNH